MKKRLPLLLFILFLLFGTAALIYYFYNKTSGVKEDLEWTTPTIKDIIKKTVATGSIKPRQEVNVKPQVSGLVDVLYVEPGQQVKKGDKIARIKLVPSEVSVNQAKNSVELARLRVSEAKRELERQRKLADSNLDVDRARANYDNAKQQEERYQSLLEEGVISEQEYQSYELQLKLAKSEYENTKVSSTNQLKAFETDVSISQQELQSAINNLQLLQEGVAGNSRQVANIIASPMDGMILDIPVEEGSSVIERNNFNEGTTIASIADMNALIFEGEVDEADVGKIKEGMPLVLTVGAIDKLKFDAMLEFIAPKGTEQEGSVKFEIRADVKPSKDVFLRAGYSANADIILDRRDKVITVQERDVIYDDEKTFVEVKTGEENSEKKSVQLGLSDGIDVEVLEGINDRRSYSMTSAGNVLPIAGILKNCVYLLLNLLKMNSTLAVCIKNKNQ